MAGATLDLHLCRAQSTTRTLQRIADCAPGCGTRERDRACPEAGRGEGSATDRGEVCLTVTWAAAADGRGSLPAERRTGMRLEPQALTKAMRMSAFLISYLYLFALVTK